MAEKILGEVKLTDVRLSFANIFDPQENTNDDGKTTYTYGASFLFPKDTPETRRLLATIKAAAEEVKQAKWGNNQPKLKRDRTCLRDGDEETWEGYEGMWYLAARNPKMPQIVDRNPSKALTERDGRPYAGCQVNAIVRLWAQDNKHGKRLNASLECIQFLRDGEAFGAKPIDPTQAFDNLADDNDDDDDDGNSLL